MKKQKLGLGKLSLSKSKIAELNKQNVKGGWNTASTNPFCLATGYYDDDACNVTENCNTANHCGNTNACGSNNCGSSNCQTRMGLISCYEEC